MLVALFSMQQSENEDIGFSVLLFISAFTHHYRCQTCTHGIRRRILGSASDDGRNFIV